MKKGFFLASAVAILVSSAFSAPPQPIRPEKSSENYDIRTDRPNTNPNSETMAARQLLATGRSHLLAQIPNSRIEDNAFGTAPEIVDIAGSTTALTVPSTEEREQIVH